MRVVRRQLGVHPRQVQHGGDLAHAVVAWNDLIEAKRIKQLTLIVIEPPHHRQLPLLNTSAPVNHGSPPAATHFCNKIGTHLPFRNVVLSGQAVRALV